MRSDPGRCSALFFFFFYFFSFPPLGAPQMLSPSQMFGTLQSPNFPGPYPRDTRLRWNVSVPDGFRLRLYFSHFHLEPSYLCEYDSVQVRPAHVTRNSL